MDELLGLLNASLELTLEAVGISDEEQNVLLSELYETRRELSERGQAIERADLVELQQFVHAGVLNKDVVDREAARRREAFSRNGGSSPEQLKAMPSSPVT